MKNLLKLLTVILALTLSLGIFTACGEDPHQHDYATLKFDASSHWYECSCGEKSGTEAHKGGTATETAKAVCEVCSQEYGELLEHTHNFSQEVASELYLKEEAKCESKAIYYYSCACGEKGETTFEYGEALGHTEVALEAVAPTCTETGLTEGKYCSVCEKVLVEQEVVAALGHTEVTLEAVAPTCTATGLTEGKKCSVCETILVKQEVVEKLPHTEVLIEAVAPTCTATGLTEGVACSVCETVLVKQEVVEKVPHTEVILEAVAPTCTETGLTEGKKCSVCEKVIVKQKVVKALGHTEVIDEAVEPTCTETGLTKGKHCSVCKTVLVEQKVVPAKGHDFIKHITKPTCLEKGRIDYKCLCGESYFDSYIDILDHEYGEWKDNGDGTSSQMCVNGCDDVIVATLISDKVLYSADDKEISFVSLKAALENINVAINGIEDIEGYLVNQEVIDVLDLEVIINGKGANRVVDTAQAVAFYLDGKLYCALNVYAYTKVIDDAEDLNYFTLKGATEENPYNEVDGYFVLAKNIDASALVLAEHKFMSNAVYPGNGYSADRGFVGVFDGNGYAIDGLALKSNGLFGQMIQAVIKNVAFTNVSLSGNYKTVFAHNINRGKTPANQFSNIECALENIYISIASIATGTARVGVLANNSTYTGASVSNVIVEYLANEAHVQANIDAGRAVYLLGNMNKDNAATAANSGVNEYKNVYTISKLPVIAHKLRPGIAINQIELIEADGKITGVGAITDKELQDYVTKLGVSVKLENLMYGVKAYDDYSVMASDAKANQASLATFDSAYWTVVNGVPYWKNSYDAKVNLVITDSEGDVVDGAVILKDAETEYTVNFVDDTHAIVPTIIAPEGVEVNGNKFKLASKPTSIGVYEVSVYAIVNGVTIERTFVINYSNADDINGKVLYSKFDKALDMDSLNKALVEAGEEEISASDITGYIVGGEEFDVLDLEVIVTSKMKNKYVSNILERTVDTAQAVIICIGDDAYYLHNVYAYTRLIDELSDLDWFSKVNMTVADYEASGATDWEGQTIYTKSGVDYVYDNYDGYYLMTKNLDGAGLGADGANYKLAGPADNATAMKKNVGLRGVFDGNGYVISNINLTCDGIFGSVSAGIIRNVAFVNLTTGGYYQSIFGRNISYSDLSGIRCYPVLENIYIEGTKFTKGKDVGILAYQSCVADSRYVVINHTLSEDEKSSILAGKQHGISGLQLTYSKGRSFEDVYVIGDLPMAIQFSTATNSSNRNNFIFAGNVLKLKDGSETEYEVADKETFAFLNQALNAEYKANKYTWKPVIKENTNADQIWKIDYMPKVKQYIDAKAMAADSAANAETIAKFNADCWTIVNGVPYWREVYRYTSSVEVKVDGKEVEDKITLENNSTEVTLNILDMGGNAVESTITAPEGITVNGNTIKLTNNPSSEGSYEVKISAILEGVVVEKYVTINYTNLVLVDSKVFYSADDKGLDLVTLNAALKEKGVEEIELADIEGYIVNGEQVDALELEVVEVDGTVEKYSITAMVNGKAYVLENVYAYTKVIDEAKDLSVFVLTGGAEGTSALGHAGYYILSKNIDATGYAHGTHTFTSGGTTYAGGTDKGFKGTLDGNGYTISNFASINNGLFGQATAPVVKNIAFTNVTISGYYGSLFAHSINRDGWIDGTGYTKEALFENVYIQIDKVTWGNSKRVGVLANNTMPLSIRTRNIVVEYTNAKADGVYANVYAKTHDFGIYGGSNNADMQKTLTYENAYAISDLPVMYSRGNRPYAAENQVEHTISNGYWIATVGAILDEGYAEFLTAKGLTLTVNMVARNLRYYADYSAMAKDAANDYASFSADYWTIANGVPVWTTAM